MKQDCNPPRHLSPCPFPDAVSVFVSTFISSMVTDYRSQLNVVGWTLCSVAAVVVGARSYCRYFLLHSFGLDDALMILALVNPSDMF